MASASDQCQPPSISRSTLHRRPVNPSNRRPAAGGPLVPDATADFAFVRVGASVPLKPSYSAFDLQNPPSQPIAVSELHHVLFLVYSQGFFIAKMEDVVGLAKEIKEKGKGPSIEDVRVVDVKVGRVSILAVSTDESTLAAAVDDNIFFFSLLSLLRKIQSKLPEKYLPPSRVALTWGGLSITSETGTPKEFISFRETDCLLVQSLRLCIRKIMGLEGSGWLFGQNGGCDEELIDYFAATEKLLDKDNPLKGNAAAVSEEGGQTISLSILPYCGAGCILQARLVVSFAVWCIHRILDLLLVESRPELWGKFTHVLNLLQGILDPAFCKPRQAIFPCKCLEPPEADSPIKESPGKAPLTSGRLILELIKNVEISILRRNGQKGTGAANIAFPMGKKNLTSVFRRYNRLMKSSS